ncbi:MAG: NAD-dependent epimerase/dehydratase family protein [Chitinophagaceae bacterium]|nr:NAD-dependent epimerase/dehydratase family protein [Chitinophagaceae bacterium]
MILVTGGAGLVGRELIAQLLAKGEHVTAIYNKTFLPSFDSPLLLQFQCNILDVAGLEDIMEQQHIQQVYHCAAIVTFNPSRKQELFKINIEGTANVVNAAINTGVKKLVHVSSVAALGRIRENGPINETMNWTGETSNSNYGKSKYLGELEVWRGIGEGLEAVMVNPTIILGNGDWEAGSSKIFKTVHDEFPWYADGVTGFVDVRDVVKAMIALMESDVNAQRFIISAENRSYQDVFNLIATAFGKKQPKKKVTPLLSEIVWRLEAIKSLFTGNDPLVTKETAATALTKAYFDNSKLGKFLPGFTYTNIENTIIHTCALLQQKLNRH